MRWDSPSLSSGGLPNLDDIDAGVAGAGRRGGGGGGGGSEEVA